MIHSLFVDPSRRHVIATYRLQLNAGFTLHDARDRVPYLAALGISHVYCSPVLAARAGSTHGYDVADPTHVSDALGGNDAFVALAAALHERGMALVLDIVPNHMGVGPDNPYWTDLLTRGRASRFADWFDVSWRATTRRLEGKLLVPVLRDTIDKVLARDELWLESTRDGLRIRYFDQYFPLDPTTLPDELLNATPDRTWSQGADGRQRMRGLLGMQHYQLAFWRTAQRDINYRRFFDVNELICLRVERPAVFEATHRAVLEFVANGVVDGLRIDHVDGLLEPGRYLDRLRAAVDARRPAAAGEPRFPIYVEKILAADEHLPARWPVEGTTGYEFLTSLEDLFIDPAGYATLEAKYRVGARHDGFLAVAVASKRRVLRSNLNADVRRVAPMLARIARDAGWGERPIASFAGAIVELVAELPVYRTYIDAEHPDATGHDRVVLVETFARVRTSAAADASAVDALEHALLDEWHDADPHLARARLSFVLRLQQLTGPAAAKGVEDTALYVYAPLTSRNEVGGDPAVPMDGAAERLHERLRERVERYPRSLNATNTHDTKRSADVRARLDALSEHAGEWERVLRRWRRVHRDSRTLVKGRMAPSRSADDFVYQALLGLWPLTGARLDDDEWLGELRNRLTEYLQKAMREAKVSTSWTDPDVQYEAAIAHFVARLLDRAANADWLRQLDQFASAIAPQALWNALGRLVVHLTAPGVPDVYQGDELWLAALVDPDNRRPVNWGMRDALLPAVQEVVAAPDRIGQLERWREDMSAGVLKLFVTHVLLAARGAHADLMLRGSYEPLTLTGGRAEHVFGFRRVTDAQELVVLVPRLTRTLGDVPLGAVWQGTDVTLVEDGPDWQCLIHGTRRVATAGLLPLEHLFSALPVAVLHRNRLR